MKHIVITKSGIYSYILDKKDQEIDIKGRFKVQKNEKISVQLTVTHQARNTKSNVSVKATVNDQAHASIIGTIIVNAAAGGTQSFLEEKILLLSPQARAEAIPNLEIKTNDVKCSHAATVGQLDEEQLFYIQGRGIPEAAAKSLIAESFLNDAD